MNVIIITGASSGIGREFARQLDRCFGRLDEFWLVGRNTKALNELSEQLCCYSRIIEADLMTDGGINKVRSELQRRKPHVIMLVNSAGYGMLGDFAEGDYDEQIGMIDLNCKALTAITYLTLPYMHRNARIIQMASAAAFVSQPGFAVYAASKSYVKRFSDALGEELRPRKIYVTSVCPGPVDTNFFQVAERHNEIPVFKKAMMANARDVVRFALQASYYKQSISVYSPMMFGLQFVSKILPHQIIYFFLRLGRNAGKKNISKKGNT